MVGKMTASIEKRKHKKKKSMPFSSPLVAAHNNNNNMNQEEEESIDKKKKQENVLQMLYLDFVINGVFLLWGPKIQFVKSGVRYKRGSL